jgi:uncharacterized protein with PIN domain
VKFIVDNNVGRLAGWLRALGYDTLFINPIEDGVLVEIAQRDGRVVLTKDTGIMRRRVVTNGEVRALKIESDDWREQLAQVMHAFGLRTEPTFERCMACNGVLESATREEALTHVPTYVHRTQEVFQRCSVCGKYYWHGTHWGRIQGEIERASGTRSFREGMPQGSPVRRGRADL